MKKTQLDKAICALKRIAEAIQDKSTWDKDVQDEVQRTLTTLAEERLIDQGRDSDIEEMDLETGVDMILSAINRVDKRQGGKVDRVNMQLELGDTLYQIGRWGEAQTYYDRALTISEECGYQYGLAKVLQRIGRLKRRQGRWHQARQALNRSAKLFKSLDRPADEAEILFNIGNIEFDQGAYENATRRFYRALTLCKDLGAEEMIANINFSLGVVHQVRGQITQAIRYYQNSLGFFKSIGDDRRVGQIYLNLGVSYREYGQWARSGMSLEESLKVARKNRDMSLIGIVYLRRAETQILLSDSEMAIMYASRAMRIFLRLDDSLGQADSYRIYGQAAGQRRAWNQASDYLTESLKLQQKYKSRLGEAETLVAWGKLHEQRDDRSGAMTHYERALTLFGDIGAEIEEQTVRQMIAQLNLGVGI